MASWKIVWGIVYGAIVFVGYTNGDPWWSMEPKNGHEKQRKTGWNQLAHRDRNGKKINYQCNLEDDLGLMIRKKLGFRHWYPKKTPHLWQGIGFCVYDEIYHRPDLTLQSLPMTMSTEHMVMSSFQSCHVCGVNITMNRWFVDTLW